MPTGAAAWPFDTAFDTKTRKRHRRVKWRRRLKWPRRCEVQRCVKCRPPPPCDRPRSASLQPNKTTTRASLWLSSTPSTVSATHGWPKAHQPFTGTINLTLVLPLLTFFFFYDWPAVLSLSIKGSTLQDTERKHGHRCHGNISQLIALNDSLLAHVASTNRSLKKGPVRTQHEWLCKIWGKHAHTSPIAMATPLGQTI